MEGIIVMERAARRIPILNFSLVRRLCLGPLITLLPMLAVLLTLGISAPSIQAMFRLLIAQIIAPPIRINLATLGRRRRWPPPRLMLHESMFLRTLNADNTVVHDAANAAAFAMDVIC